LALHCRLQVKLSTYLSVQNGAALIRKKEEPVRLTICAAFLALSGLALAQDAPTTPSAIKTDAFPSGSYVGKLVEVGGRNRSSEIRFTVAADSGSIEVARSSPPCNRRLPLRVTTSDNGVHRLESSGSIAGCERHMEVTVVNGVVDGTYTGPDNSKFKVTARKQEQ
jgi:hypothetical protein